MRTRRFGVAVLFVGALSMGWAARTYAAVTGHLYAVTRSQILRFPLNDGIPGGSPDLRIKGRHGSIAVGIDGTLYAVAPKHEVDVFPFGARQPSRSIRYPDPRRRCESGDARPQALTVNQLGYVFVSYSTYVSGLRPPAVATRRRHNAPCTGVAVFAPGVSGSAPPVAVIPVDAENGSLAVDSNGVLYAADEPLGFIGRYLLSSRYPSPVGMIKNGVTFADGMAFDDAGYLYEADGNVGGGAPRVNVYAPGSGPTTPPARTINFGAESDWSRGQIAVRGAYLYTSLLYGTVAVFDASASGGPTSPIATFQVPNEWNMTVGP